MEYINIEKLRLNKLLWIIFQKFNSEIFNLKSKAV